MCSTFNIKERKQWIVPVAVTNTLFPVSCCGCEGTVEKDNKYGICSTCMSRIEKINVIGCKYCGKPVNARDVLCSTCHGKKSSVDMFYTSCYYGGIIKNIIKRFKYGNGRYLSLILGEIIIDLFNSIDENIDCMVPIPLSSARKRERGYNQAEILAGFISKNSGLKMSNKYIKRIKNTKPQSALKRNERFQNIKGVFRASPKVKGKTILIIDDIATTGATIQNAAAALKTAGCSNVMALVAAHGK